MKQETGTYTVLNLRGERLTGMANAWRMRHELEKVVSRARLICATFWRRSGAKTRRK